MKVGSLFFSFSRAPIGVAVVGSLAWGVVGMSTLRSEDDVEASLRAALSFHASFDQGPDADFARGDRLMYHAASHDRRQSLQVGLPATGEVGLAEAGDGRSGQALDFRISKGPVVLFKADKNLADRQPGWSGTLSFWLNLDPAADLAPGFCDPVQVTSKKWDDAAIFVEFEKRAEGVPFRLGVYADTAVWNPQGRKWEEIPAGEKPLITVAQPPFARGKWTHVGVVWDRFNSGKAEGVAHLYLNGQSAGRLGPRVQTFTWDPAQAVILLGVAYAGKMDDFAVFDRALNAEEMATLAAPGLRLHRLHPNPAKPEPTTKPREE